MTAPHARTLTAEKFASLWREPKDAYPFVKVEKRDEMIETMRHRAECFIAEALGRPRHAWMQSFSSRRRSNSNDLTDRREIAPEPDLR